LSWSCGTELRKNSRITTTSDSLTTHLRPAKQLAVNSWGSRSRSIYALTANIYSLSEASSKLSNQVIHPSIHHCRLSTCPSPPQPSVSAPGVYTFPGHPSISAPIRPSLLRVGLGCFIRADSVVTRFPAVKRQSTPRSRTNHRDSKCCPKRPSIISLFPTFKSHLIRWIRMILYRPSRYC